MIFLNLTKFLIYTMITTFKKGGTTMLNYCTSEFLDRIKLLLEEHYDEEKEILQQLLKLNYNEISIVDITGQAEMTDSEKNILYSYYTMNCHLDYLKRAQHVRGMKQMTNKLNKFHSISNISDTEACSSDNRGGKLFYYAMAMGQYQNWNDYCRDCYNESFEDHVLQATSRQYNPVKTLKRMNKYQG